jgi:dihydroorotate dehydrogenase electron transfer subunit
VNATIATQASAPHRARFDASVEFNRPLCREHFLLRMRIDPATPFPATKPGVFIQLGCRTPDGAIDLEALQGHDREWMPGQVPTLTQPELCHPLAMLRRPFSLAGRGDDAGGTWVEIVHRVVGVGTAWLAALKPGDAVDLIGPLGNHFALPEGKSLGLLVGGGVGLPPMFYLAEAMRAKKWDAIGFVGAMTHDLLAVTFRARNEPDALGTPGRSVEEFARHDYPAVITTDDGTRGLHGRITAGLERVLHSLSRADAARAVIYTCGPEPMMHAVAKLAKQHNIDCQVCLEQAMACGMATCQSCIVKIEDAKKPHGTTEHGRPWRFKLACTDGPVFPADVVVW